MKLMVYVDGSDSSANALRYAAEMAMQLDAELTVITVRSGTHAAEDLPPFGGATPIGDRTHLPKGLQVLTQALDVLTGSGLFDSQDAVQIDELSNGHIFICESRMGKRIPFYECFGGFIETLNQEIERNKYELLIIAPPKRSRLKRMATGDAARKLALDLHASVLIIRGEKPGRRFLVCSDGSPAAKRSFPLLKRMLPFITPPVELAYVRTEDSDDETIQNADHCLEMADKWLNACGKRAKIHRLEGNRPADMIASVAGEDAVVFIGASLRHDVYKRMMGSLGMQLLSRTTASVLVVKALPEGGDGFLEDPVNC